MIVVSYDPGFANLGWAIIEVVIVNGVTQEKLLDAGVIVTKKNKRKDAPVNDDMISRISKLHEGMNGLVYRRMKPRSRLKNVEFLAMQSCDYVASEAMSWGFQGTRAHRQVGMAWGVIVSVTKEHKKALVTVKPGDLKFAITGDKKASKIDVQAALLKRPGFEKLESILASWPKGKREHIGDAAAAGVASTSSAVAQFHLERST